MSWEHEQEILLNKIKKLRSIIDRRTELQQELKIIRSKTPKSEKVIEDKLKKIRDFSQEILDLALHIERQRPNDPILNRKRWEVMFKLFKAEEEQINGLLASPTLALSILTNWKKEPIKPTKEKHV